MKFSSVVHAKHVNDFLICFGNKLQIPTMSQNLQFFSFKHIMHNYFAANICSNMSLSTSIVAALP